MFERLNIANRSALRACAAVVVAATLLAVATLVPRWPSRARSSAGVARQDVGSRYGTLHWAQPKDLKRCGMWPINSTCMRTHLESLGVKDVGQFGWQCIGFEQTVRMSGAQVSVDECGKWCESRSDPLMAMTGNWCCAWAPTSRGAASALGTCAWSDGLATFVPLAPDRCVRLQPSSGRPPSQIECAQPLAYEACTWVSAEFTNVVPDVAEAGLVTHPSRKPSSQPPWLFAAGGSEQASSRDPFPRDYGEQGVPRGPFIRAVARLQLSASANASDAPPRPSPRQFASRSPPVGCRLGAEEPLAAVRLASVGDCAAACDVRPDGKCAAFAFSEEVSLSAAAPDVPSCLLLARCRLERQPKSQTGRYWDSFRRKDAAEVERTWAAPLQLGSPLGTAAPCSGTAGLDGIGFSPSEHMECAPEALAFVMQGEGFGTCSQLCVSAQLWPTARRFGARRGTCAQNGCPDYLVSRKQAGMPFDLYRCTCPSGNTTALYACTADFPALT